jgi:hypothetical protein
VRSSSDPRRDVTDSKQQRDVTSDDPPYATNGNVIPVSGMSFALPPTITRVWNAMMNDRPVARRRRNVVGARSAMSMPRYTNTR